MVWFYPSFRILQSNRFDNFQSHYGLILSEDLERIAEKRLELSIPLWSDFIKLEEQRKESSEKPFNPTMVWFYLNLAYIPFVAVVAFQSHYGLILSREIEDEEESEITAFNPTMVWFYLI